MKHHSFYIKSALPLNLPLATFNLQLEKGLHLQPFSITNYIIKKEKLQYLQDV